MAPGDEKAPEFVGPHGDEGSRGSSSWPLLTESWRSSQMGQGSVVMLLGDLSELELYALVQGEWKLR